MPKIPAERLTEIGRALFVAAGTPPEEAETVMRHVVAAKLAGHDSHGVIHIPTDIARIKGGHIVPGAPWKVRQESATTTAGALRPGCMIRRDGRPTTDASRLRRGGALLPVGGSEGYKGYGLSVMVEILCGLLTGLGFGVEPTGRHNDGCFMAVFKVDAFRPLGQFKQDIGEFVQYLKATKPAEGSSGVYYPAEIEHMREEDRRADGSEIEDATWYKLRSLAEGYGLAARLGFTEIE